MPSPITFTALHRSPQEAAGGLLAFVAMATTAWFFGFSVVWSVSIAAVVVSAVALIAGRSFDEASEWPAPSVTAPRGTRLAVSTIEQALAATDRLARPRLARWLRGLVLDDRADHLAREQLLRQLRALIAAEARRHGLDPVQQPGLVAERIGVDAATLLQLPLHAPATSAIIARALASMEHATHPSSAPR